MSGTELSNNFTLIYPELVTYANKINNKFYMRKDTSIVLAESYIHIHRYKEEITNNSVLTAYCKNFIKSNMFWTNGVYKKESLNSIEYDESYIDYSKMGNNTFTQDSLIEEEYDYQVVREELELIYKDLSLYNKGLYDIYFRLNKRKTIEVAEHLNISNTSAHRVLKEIHILKEKIKDKILGEI